MDRDIVRRAQAGDHDAFAALARDAVARLYGTARLILLREDLARVAAEDALTTAWRDVRGLRDLNQSDPWLLGILVRSCQAITRNERGHTVTEIAPDAPGNKGESDKAFGRLTQDDRAVLALAFFAGVTVPDLSVALSLPAATTHARLDHAQAMLLAELDADDTAESRADLAWRLRAWMAHEAEPPDLTGVVEAVAGATAAARQRRRPQPARRRIGLALVTALALTVAVTAGVFVARIVDVPDDARPVGLINPTGDISVLHGGLERPVVAVLNDGRVLVVGLGDTLLGGIVYDPATGSYGEPIRDHVLRRDSTATTLQNNLVLLTGGMYGGSERSADTTALFDPFSETFGTTNPLTVPRVRHAATLLDDGRVLVTGGQHLRGLARTETDYVLSEYSAEIYDPATGTFSPTGPMLQPRAGHTATKLTDGRVLMAGGYSLTGQGVTTFSAQAEIFDPATGKFLAAGSMTTPRGDHSATLLADGRVLIVGGADQLIESTGELRPISNTEIFDPRVATFTPAAALATERIRHTATLMADGRVFIAGGQNERGGPRSSEIFDPIAGTFAAGPRAAVPHHATLAPLMGGGRIFLTGSGAGASEVFDPLGGGVAATASESPATRAFSPVDTNVLHESPLLVELQDGRILIIGGGNLGDPEHLAPAEIFDPATGRTMLVGPVVPRSWWAGSTRLADGRVVMVGSDEEGRSVAELFDPATNMFEPAPDRFVAALAGRHLLATSGLPDGRLLLNDDSDSEVIRWFDAETGMSGAPMRVCGYAAAAIALDAGRVLVSACDQQAVIADATAGTTDLTGLRFDRAFRLDARRIALAITTYTTVYQDSTQTERIDSIFDQSDESIQSVPARTQIGGAVAVAGDRLLAFGSSSEASDAAVAYDTRTWAASNLGPMLAPRSGASTAILQDGRVLIVGGVRQSPDRTDPVRPGAELFDPKLVP